MGADQLLHRLQVPCPGIIAAQAGWQCCYGGFGKVFGRIKPIEDHIPIFATELGTEIGDVAVYLMLVDELQQGFRLVTTEQLQTPLVVMLCQ